MVLKFSSIYSYVDTDALSFTESKSQRNRPKTPEKDEIVNFKLKPKLIFM
ncbi:hypothetical protein TUM4433_04920 [Shewanella schlegeliana]|nr:hypothetical protein TUM4433_04920 [Shewanella schlegeliana]